jgi:hypothetical protein
MKRLVLALAVAIAAATPALADPVDEERMAADWLREAVSMCAQATRQAAADPEAYGVQKIARCADVSSARETYVRACLRAYRDVAGCEARGARLTAE